MIRRAMKKDITAIQRLMESEPGFWHADWRKDVVERMLSAADDLCFVWDEAEQIKGVVCAHDLGSRAYLNELIVARTARRNGIARQLVEHVQQILMNRGCTVLISDVWKSSVPFYTSLGWTAPDAVLLRKQLGKEAETQEKPPS